MIRKSPELMLYLAHCNADGVREGQFNIEDTNPRSIERDLQAIKTVQKYLDYSWGVEFDYGSGVSSNEKEALVLIDYATKIIPGAEGVIRLSHCAHGRLVFNRKINFPGYVMDQTSELLEKLKDYPKDHNIPDYIWQKAFRSNFLW